MIYVVTDMGRYWSNKEKRFVEHPSMASTYTRRGYAEKVAKETGGGCCVYER